MQVLDGMGKNTLDDVFITLLSVKITRHLSLPESGLFTALADA